MSNRDIGILEDQQYQTEKSFDAVDSFMKKHYMDVMYSYIGVEGEGEYIYTMQIYGWENSDAGKQMQAESAFKLDIDKIMLQYPLVTMIVHLNRE